MAEITEFNLGQGETFKILMTLVNDETGIPLNIASQSFSGQIRENYSTDILAGEFGFEKVVPYESGSLFISLLPEQTIQFNQRKYVYDIIMTSGSMTRRVLEGYLVIRPASTR